MLQDRRVTIELSRALPLIKVDANLLEQLFVNIFENVAKHTPSGAEVSIRAAADESQLTVEVEDTGPGVPAGMEARIFDKLVRGTDAASQGFGLGLAICRAVAEAHGGTIEAIPSQRGALFRLTLPLTERAPEVPSELESGL